MRLSSILSSRPSPRPSLLPSFFLALPPPRVLPALLAAPAASPPRRFSSLFFSWFVWGRSRRSRIRKDGAAGRKVKEERTVCTSRARVRRDARLPPITVRKRTLCTDHAVLTCHLRNGSCALMQPARGMHPHGFDYSWKQHEKSLETAYHHPNVKIPVFCGHCRQVLSLCYFTDPFLIMLLHAFGIPFLRDVFFLIFI